MNELWLLFPGFPQLGENRQRVKAALEAAGLRWINGGGDGNIMVRCKSPEQHSALWEALAGNRTSDGCWPYGARGWLTGPGHPPTGSPIEGGLAPAAC